LSWLASLVLDGATQEIFSAMISFPFWLLTSAAATESPIAFSSVELMGGYLKAQSVGQWAVQLVNRYSVATILAELRRKGLDVVLYDVNQDGSGGVQVTLQQILAAVGA
jgi:hypothetical protein